MQMASIAMALACLLVGLGGLFNDEMSAEENINNDSSGGNNENVQMGEEDNTNATNSRSQLGLLLELLGVSFTSFQCSLGEASLLALAGKFDSNLIQKQSPSSVSSSIESYSAVDNGILFSHEEYPENNNTSTTNDDDEQSSSFSSEGILMKSEKQSRKCISAFSSGAGLAGIVGYAYKSLLADLFGWGLSYIVWSAVVFAFAYYRIYCAGLYEMEIRLEESAQNRLEDERGSSSMVEVEELNDATAQRSSLEMITKPQEEEDIDTSPTLLPQYPTESTTTATTKLVYQMTGCEHC